MSQPNKTRVQVATDSSFSNVVHDVEGAYTTALQVAEDALPKGVNLYARGMHGHPTTGDSGWSTIVQFKIKMYWEDWDGSANGLEYSLNSANSLYISAVAISATQVVVSYYNTSQSGKLYAVVLTISGSTISAGTPVQCNSSNSDYISAVTLSPTQVVVSYRNNSHSNYLYAVVLTISGGTISAGTPVLCHSTNSIFISAVAISPTKVVVSYDHYDLHGYLFAVVLTISGSTISAGTPVQCNSSNGYYVSAVAISTTQVVVSYHNEHQSGKLYAVVLTISGSTISAGTPVQCNSTYSILISVVAISATQVVVSYRNNSHSNYLYAVVLTISGSTISVGTPVRCNSTISNYISAVAISPTQVVVSYSNNSHDNYLYAVALTIDGNTISAGTPVQCNIKSTTYISATKVGNDVLLAYNRDDLALYGKMLIG